MLMFYTALIEAEEEKIAFEHIYYTYRKRMLKIAERILMNHEDAEDAVQNALLGIAKTMKTVPTGCESELRAYVFTVVRNAAFALLPNQAKREQCIELSVLPLSTGEDLFERITQLEDYKLLMKLISELPIQYREVLMLRYVVGLKPQEISELLVRKVGTVQQQLTRAKKLLAALYEKEAEGNGGV